MFPGLSYQAPGVHASHETLENTVSYGDPLFSNFFKGQAWIGATATDLGNPQIPSKTVVGSISAITAANPAVITLGAGHGFVANQRVYIDGVAGMVEINNLITTIASVTATTITTAINAVGFTPFVAGNDDRLTLLGISNVLRPGLLMGYHTVNKEWLPWAPGASDGTENIRGVLYVEVQMNLAGVATPRFRGHIMWGGPVKSSALIVPGNAYPGLDNAGADGATARTQMEGVRYWLDDYFQQ